MGGGKSVGVAGFNWVNYQARWGRDILLPDPPRRAR